MPVVWVVSCNVGSSVVFCVFDVLVIVNDVSDVGVIVFRIVSGGVYKDCVRIFNDGWVGIGMLSLVV